MNNTKKNILIAVLTIGLISLSVYTVAINVPTSFLNPLSDQEVADLQFNREEEKVARDVYQTLYISWNFQVFDNIARSEQSHMDSILDLQNQYNIEDPVPADTVGVYNNTDLSELYLDLVADGQTSLVNALEVGAFIEEFDILDLLTFIGNSNHTDVIATYEQLLMGSRNHLRAFVGALADLGVTYEPLLLEEADYQAIISSPVERGF